MFLYSNKFFAKKLTESEIKDKAMDYAPFFTDYPDEIVYQSLLMHIENSNFFPSVHELRKNLDKAIYFYDFKVNLKKADAEYKNYVDSGYRTEDDFIFQEAIKAGF